MPGIRTARTSQEPPFFEDLPPEPRPLSDIAGARVLAVLGDSVTTDHISPAGPSPRTDRPPGTCWSTASSKPTGTRSGAAAATTK